ncbi:MAG: putative porin [Bacteroidia bacterium]
MNRLLRVLLFLLIPLQGIAQFGTPNNSANQSGFDSTGVGKDSSRVQFADFNLTETADPTLKRVSFALDRFQFYLPVYDNQFANSSLGNNGTAVSNLNFNPIFNQGFNQGFNSFDNYLLPIKKTLFFDAQSPYTEAFYVQGSKEEAFFHLKHTQNVGRKLNFGLEYQRINSLGYYPRQTAQHSALRFHSWFRPGKGHYQALLAVGYHKGSSLENGGITPAGDSLYLEGIETNRQLYPVWLIGARNDLFNNGILLRHFYDVNPPEKDTLGNPLVGRVVRLQLTHAYEFNKNSYIEENPPTGFYPLILDSSRVNSNYTSRVFENEFSVLLLRSLKDSVNSSGWEAKGFIKNQNVDFSNNFNLPVPGDFSLNTSNLSAGGFIKINFKEWLLLNANTEVFFAGFNAGDISLNASLISKPNKNVLLRTGISSFSQEVDYRLQHFISNFNSWSNNFAKTNLLKIFGSLDLVKQGLRIELSNRILGNFVFVNENQIPEQSSKAINVFSAEIKHELRLKKWGLTSRVLLQQVSDQSALRLPLLQFQESIFREGLISRTTPWRIGIDIIGCTSFKANAYAPYSSMFYLQNAKTNQGILQANAYISAKIKRARIFIMLEHANANLGGLRSDLIPFYPLPDRLLKIGLSWVFFD